MIPTTITQKLARLRTRERLLDLAWGGARLIAIVLVLLLLAMAIDWLVDRDLDTPMFLRRFMSAVQVVAALALAFFLLLWPLRKKLPDAALALRVEDRHRKLRHRLISAVELNEPDADTVGMSRELIDVVTREAVQQTSGVDFARVADGRRLGWGLAIALPVMLLAALPFLLFPETASVLLARQLGIDRDIPRDVTIEPATVVVWPSGEKVTLKFKVTGPDIDELTGDAFVKAEGRQADVYLITRDPDQPTGTRETDFVAELPASSTSFTYTARLGDGRTKMPGRIRYEPRPVVIEQNAWVQLPEFVGIRQDGSRYELPQSRGDILGIPGSKARVSVKMQKRVMGGMLYLLGPAKSDPELSPEEQGPEVIKRSTKLELKKDLVLRVAAGVQDGMSEQDVTDYLKWAATSKPESADKEMSGLGKVKEIAWWIDNNLLTVTFKDDKVVAHNIEFRHWQGTFDLRTDETGYRVVVVDEHGFENVPPPRRSVRVVSEEPPQVALLREQFPPKLKELVSAGSDDFIIEGLPLPVDGSIPIAYTASGPYGLGAARFLYRVLKKVESGNDDPGDEKWIPLPLQEIAGSEAAGPFDPRMGAFARSEPSEQIFFHAIPDETPLPRTLGGGRFDFKTTGIPDGKGGLRKLKIGDQIEYCVEVFADKKGGTDRPWARSDTRVKTIVAFDELYRWLEDNFQEAQRIRQLDNKQRGLFDEK